MSRADWITIAVTLFLATAGYFVSGPKVALGAFVLGALIFLGVLFFGRANAQQHTDPGIANQTTISPAFNQTGPTINVHVGTASGHAAAVAPAPPIDVAPRRALPNVRFVNGWTTYVTDAPILGEGFKGLCLRETNPEFGMQAIIASFRNEPIFEFPVMPIHNARAHLKFFNEMDLEIGAGVSRACWLNSPWDMFDLVPGGPSGNLVVITFDGTHIRTPFKSRESVALGSEVIRDLAEQYNSLPRTVEISILDSRNQLVLRPVRLGLSLTDRQLHVR